MAQIFTPGLRADSATLVQKVRRLPVPGTIDVAMGDRVTPEMVVATASLPGELVIIRLPERMGLQIFEVLQGMQVAVGDTVERDQLLCQHAGLFGLLKTSATAPVAGTVEFIAERTGHIGIRRAATILERLAYVQGTVVAIEEGQSVTLEMEGSFVQGIFGVGGERWGTLHCLDCDPDTMLTDFHIPEQCEGLVLAGGTCPGLLMLQEAAKRGARGLITGAIDDEALKGFLGYDLGIALTGDEDIPFTLIITEGFGRMGISERVLSILQEGNGNIVSINGATQVRAGAVRPEILIARDTSDSKEAKEVVSGLAVGIPVRVIRTPYFGLTGVVHELPQEAEVIPTGATIRVIRVKLDSSGEIVTVPRANVELLQ